MKDENKAFNVDEKDLEFVREISGMSVHRKILLQGILFGLTMAEQSLESEIESERYY